jgi:hypothetical protein
MLAIVQPPDPGFVLVRASPSALTATHSDALAHETSVSELPPLIDVGGDQCEPPDPLLTIAAPRSSTTTQGPSATHETAFKGSPASIAIELHDGCEAVGSLVLSAFP